MQKKKMVHIAVENEIQYRAKKNTKNEENLFFPTNAEDEDE